MNGSFKTMIKCSFIFLLLFQIKSLMCDPDSSTTTTTTKIDLESTRLISSPAEYLLISSHDLIDLLYDSGSFYQNRPVECGNLFKDAESTTSEPLLQRRRRSKRIVNGERTSVATFPWMVYLFYYYDDEYQSQCTGFYISNNYILTAAHCFDVNSLTLNQLDKSLVNVYIKANRNSTDFYINSDRSTPERYGIEIHELYNNENYEYDIALIRVQRDENILKHDLFGSPSNRPCLFKRWPEQAYEMTNECFLLGYGISNDSDEYFYQIEHLKVAYVTECELDDGDEEPFYNEKLLICKSALENGSAFLFQSGYGHQGDSGGPLICKFDVRNEQSKWYFAGILSHSINATNLYTRMDVFYAWIRERIVATMSSHSDRSSSSSSSNLVSTRTRKIGRPSTTTKKYHHTPDKEDNNEEARKSDLMDLLIKSVNRTDEMVGNKLGSLFQKASNKFLAFAIIIIVLLVIIALILVGLFVIFIDIKKKIKKINYSQVNRDDLDIK